MELYHGSNIKFKVASPLATMVNSRIDGIGIYMTTDKALASAYGNLIYTFDVELKNQISLTNVTLSHQMVVNLLEYILRNGVNYCENYGYEHITKDVINTVATTLITESISDVDLIHDIANANDCINIILNWLVMYNINYCKHDTTYIIYQPVKPVKMINTTLHRIK